MAKVTPPGNKRVGYDLEPRLRLFDQATERHRKRPPVRKSEQPRERGWTKLDLYERGGTHC